MLIANPIYDTVFKRLMENDKDFVHTPDLEEIKVMTDILHYVGTDPEERKAIERELEAWRSVHDMFEKYQQTFEAQQRALREKDALIEELQKRLNEQQEKH